jgi:hypothetical protein
MDDAKPVRLARGRMPAGLAGAVALAVAVEAAVGAFDGPSSFIVASWRDSARAAVGREARAAELLCFGDSQVKCGLLPPVLARRAGASAFNLAVVGGQPASSLSLFERALDAGARPRAVVVGYYPALLGADLRINTTKWAELLGPIESLGLLIRSRDGKLAGPLLARVALPSLRRRDDARAAVLAALRNAPDPGVVEARAFRRNWRVNSGAHALEPKPDFRDDARPETTGRRWKCKPENARDVRRFLALARDRGVAVFWMMPTDSPLLSAARARDGRDPAYERFVSGLQAEFPGMTVIDPRPSLTDPSSFSDVCHLDRRGAVALSLAAGDAIAARLAGRDPRRWVAPAAEKPPAALVATDAIEDVGRSRTLVR